MKIVLLFILVISSARTFASINCRFSQEEWKINSKDLKMIDFKEKKGKNEYIFHIHNVDKLSQVDDYVVVDNFEHTITYPLMCERE